MKKSEDKRFACLVIGAVMLAVFMIHCKAVERLCADGWWPLVMVYVSIMLGLTIFSADMTPEEGEK